MLQIKKTVTNFEKEPLRHPFGFKGGAIREIWQTAAVLEDADGTQACGMGCQGVLWSDAAVFAAQSPAAGSSMMYLISDFAARQLEGKAFADPFAAMDAILPAVREYGRMITGRPDLRETFLLNALVPVDLALWKLYAKKSGIRSFDGLIPPALKQTMGHRYDRIQTIPLVSYGVTLDEVRSLIEEGFFFLKIKIGSDPMGDGDPDKMLAWDKERLTQIHRLAKDVATPYTDSGHIAYYLDANGRYDSKERLSELLRHAEEIGMLERTIILEEPFPEEYLCSVADLPVRVAADESAHSAADVAKRIRLGYGAIALKPIAKSLTTTFRMIEEASRCGVPCFCADLTVGPLQVEVNKTVAARLACLPGLKLPVVESNGWQNYLNWDAMCEYSPSYQKSWTNRVNGGYELSPEFYEQSAGILEDYPHYSQMAVKG